MAVFDVYDAAVCFRDDDDAHLGKCVRIRRDIGDSSIAWFTPILFAAGEVGAYPSLAALALPARGLGGITYAQERTRGPAPPAPRP